MDQRDSPDSFDALARLAARVLGASMAWICLRDHAARAPVSYRAPGSPPLEDAVAVALCRLAADLDGPGAPRPLAPLGPELDDEARRSAGTLADSSALVLALRSTNGRPAGALCVLDAPERTWTEAERATMAELGAAAETELRYLRLLERAASERRAVQRLAAKNAATRVLYEVRSIESAIDGVLASLGGSLGWSAGTFWRAAEDGLSCRATWQAPDAGASAFLDATCAVTFRKGEGLPGRVWESGEAAWITDVLEDVNFPRGSAAASAELHGGLAFPIMIGDRFYGVMEFFTRDVVGPDPGLLELLNVLGREVGEFVRRRQTEEALRESEERFRAFSESVADATFTIDEDSTILYANPAAERIFGFTRKEMTGSTLDMLIPTRQREAHHEGIARYLATGRRNIPWNGAQLPGLRKDGTEVPLEISFGEYMRDGRHFFTGIARDITERVRQETELERTAAELKATVSELEKRTADAEAARAEVEEASRVKSDFLAVMSHELRTPLNAIIGYVELLIDGIPVSVPEPAGLQLRRVQVASHHLLQLIEEILSFSDIESGRQRVSFEETDVAEILEEIRALSEPLAAEKGLELTVEAPEEARPFRTDPAKVRQILVNLVSNAVKFTEEGKITVRAEQTDGELAIHVSDTGIGIAPEHHETIFETFRQVEPSATRTQGGTGLGLTVSHTLAELLGGELTVRSAPGEGSTFTLRLPEGGPAEHTNPKQRD